MTRANESVSIILNGDTRDIPSDLTINGLLEHLKITGKQLAVARNSEIVPKFDYETVEIENGDHIEIVHAIGGGAS